MDGTASPVLLNNITQLHHSNNTKHATTTHNISNNTITFIVGFGILIIFILVGILASAFLCITLKKDPYLWEVERERQLQEKAADSNLTTTSSKERDKLTTTDEKIIQESTQF